MESILFGQMDLIRNNTLAIAAELSEQQADVVPRGFNNNIRWHLGHILTTHERLAFRLIQEPYDLPEDLMSLFLNGTKPADWQTVPPDLSVLFNLLREQPGRIRERLQGRIDEQLSVKFKDFSLLKEALLYSTAHESLHTGYMMALKKAVAAQL